MKWRSAEPRSYYKKYEKVDVNNGNDWFDVYRLPNDVYVICEPQHIQEVNIFLIIGNERALLLDTGMGICNIKPLVRELYNGEVIVVNSHFHLDHIANNSLFQPIYIFDDPYAIRRAKLGAPKEALGNQLDEDMFLYGYPVGFDPNAYYIPPYEYIVFQDGYAFDLGGRTLRVIHTPGHSDDCIMLYDEVNQEIFTGDMFYLGALYAYFSGEEAGNADLNAYLHSLNWVVAQIPETATVLCSHNDFITDMLKLKKAVTAFSSLIDADQALSVHASAVRIFEKDGISLKEYNFDEFSIICRND